MKEETDNRSGDADYWDIFVLHLHPACNTECEKSKYWSVCITCKCIDGTYRILTAQVVECYYYSAHTYGHHHVDQTACLAKTRFVLFLVGSEDIYGKRGGQSREGRTGS